MSKKKEDNEKGKKQLGDKIFGAHNNPTQESNYGDTFELDMKHRMVEDSYDEEEYLHRKKLEESVFAAFQSSRWYPLSYKKKIPKDLIPHLFQDVLEKLEDTEFGLVVLLLLTVGAAQQAWIKALVGNLQMSVLRSRKPCRPQCLLNRSGVVRSRFEVCVYR